MSNTSASKTFLPQLDGRALDFIKLFAAVFMVVDHINALLLQKTQLWMFLVGRGAFPLFCFGIALAVARKEKTQLPDYAARLLLLALCVEPVSQFIRHIADMNVIFTLAAGAVLAGVIEKFNSKQLLALCLFVPVYSLGASMTEFGMAGVLLPAALLLAIRGRSEGLPMALWLLLFINVNELADLFHSAHAAAGASTILLMGAASAAFPLMAISLCRGLPGQRFLPKYALHVFYPLHLLVLFFIAQLFFK